MKNLRKISLVLVLALIVGTFGNVLPASAAKEIKSSWSFKTASGKTVEVGKTINLKKNEFQDFNLYKSGSEIKQNDSRYTVTWSSSDKNVVWVDASNGKLRADKFKKLSDEYYEATVTAKIINKTTRAVARRSFIVSVGTPAPKADHIAVQFKDGTDPSETLKIGQSYTLETLAYDKDDKLVADAGLYYAYFCDKSGITIAGSTIKPTADGEYTITVGAFETEAEAKAATSADDAAYIAFLENLVVEANKPQITDLRQIDLYTVALTFNKAEYATDLLNNSNKLTITYYISGSQYTEIFQELMIDDENPATVLITLYSNLTEGVTYNFTYKSTETVSATVTGSGTKPARIELVSETVEVEREYFFKVKVLNDKGVDITEMIPYTCTFEDMNSEFVSYYMLDPASIYFFEAGKTAVIRAKLDLGYDDYGNPITPLYHTAQFTSIPKAKPIYSNCNGFFLGSATDVADSLTYTTGSKTICMDDFDQYLYATFTYTDEYREPHKRYIAHGQDAEDGKVYTYVSSNPNVLEVDPSSGLLYPFSKGSASIHIKDEENHIVGTVGITVGEARYLASLSITNQSATKLSATGNLSADEYITLKLNAKDQYGGKMDDVDYTFALTGATDIDNSFHSAFSHSLDGDTLKIWEGPLLSTIVTSTSPVRRFTVTVTAERLDKKLDAKTFNITVKNVTNITATPTPKLTISQTNIDLKLDKDNLSDYESTIGVISTDSNDYFIRRENIKLIRSASNADKQKGVFSVLILLDGEAVTDSILPIEISDNKLVLKPVTRRGSEIEKAKLGTYSIRLYRGNGTKAQPITTGAVILTDSTPAVDVSIKDKNIADTDSATLESAMTFKRGTTDISSYVEIIDFVPRLVNKTYQISELTLKVYAKELNSNWPSEEDYTTVVLDKLNLQFRLPY